jgi:hypothetical protein
MTIQRSNASMSMPLPAGEEPAIVDLEPGRFRFYEWKNLFLLVWLGESDIANVARLAQSTASIHERHPEGVSAVHILHGSVKLPDTETRAALLQLSNQYATRLGGIAVVLRGSGFWASTMRSIVTALRVVGARDLDMRIHASVEDVAEWLPAVHLKRTGISIDREQLLSVLKQIEQA